MADPVASMEKIVKIGLRIKEAVDTVRRNEEVCREIRQRVLRFSAILSQLQRTGMLSDDNNPAMTGALEDLEETLRRALDLVAACQGRRRSAVHRLVMAGGLARKLREVKDDISNKVMLASFAINANTTIMLLTLHFGGAYPRPRPPEDAGGLIEISHNSDSTEDATMSDINDANPIFLCYYDILRYNLLAYTVLTKKKHFFLLYSGSGGSEQNGDENNILGECEALLAPLIAITFREFKFSELRAATNGFLDSNIVGRGGIATVYKGVLNDGSVIAIKKFRWAPRLGWAHIYEQLLLVSKLEHKNIIKVLGYAHEVGPVMEWMKGRKGTKRETEYIWVEEYGQKGTLHDIIHSQEHRLDWSSLIQIIEGIAQGVNYLHEQRIVHLDLKPTNIVMDVHMNPKITDFEVAKVLSGQMKRDIITAGTFQYIAPEYLTDGVVSTMNDVYAFGITLLETVSGIRRRSSQHREFQLHQWAWKALEGRRKEFDPELFGESQLVEIKRCIKLGLLCAQHEWRDRPTMADVLLMLNGKKQVPTPKKPAYIKSNA